MSTEANKAIVRNWVAEVWNKGNLALADEVIATSYVLHDPVLPIPVNGIDGIIGLVAMYRTAMPDIAFTIEDIVAEGERVVWRFVARGTQTGPLMGIPPSGKALTVAGMVLSRFSDGKWAEDWTNIDNLGMLQQMEVIPAAG